MEMKLIGLTRTRFRANPVNYAKRPDASDSFGRLHDSDVGGISGDSVRSSVGWFVRSFLFPFQKTFLAVELGYLNIAVNQS